MSGALGRLTVDLMLGTAQWASGLSKAEYQAQRTAEEIDRRFRRMGDNIAGSVKNFAAGLAAAFSVQQITSFVNGVQQAADELGKLSTKTGASVTFLAEMGVAADLSGVSVQQLGQGMNHLAKSVTDAVGNSGSKAARVFRELGVAVKDSSGNVRDSESIFRDTADAFAKLEDGPVKAAAAMVLYGRSGADLLPLFREQANMTDAAKAAADEYGRAMRDLTKPATDFNDSLTVMQTRSKSVGAGIAQSVLPYLTQLVQQLTGASNKSVALNEAWVALEFGGKLVVAVMDGLGTGLLFVGRQLGGIAEYFWELATAPWGDKLKRSGQALQDAGNWAAEAINNARIRKDTLFDPAAHLNITSGMEKLKKAGQGLADAVADGDAAAKKSAGTWDHIAYIKEYNAQVEQELVLAVMRYNDAAAEATKTAKELADEQAAEKWLIDSLRKNEALWLAYRERMGKAALTYNQVLIDKQIEQWRGFYDSIESAGRDAFDALFSSTEGGWDGMLKSLRESFKRILLDYIYNALARPLILQITAQMTGGVGQVGASSVGGIANIGNIFSPGGALGGLGSIWQGISTGGMSGGLGALTSGLGGWASGLASGGLGGLIGGIGAAIPYIGLALGAIQLLSGLKKPSLPYAQLGFGRPNSGYEDNIGVQTPFGSLGFTDEGTQYFSGEAGKAALDVINGLLGAVNTTITSGDVRKRITERLANYTFSGLKGNDILENDVPAMLKEVFGQVFDEISPAWLEKIQSFSGNTEDFTKLIEQFVLVADLSKGFDLSAALAPPESLMQQYQNLRGDVNDYVAEMDDSSESLNTLTGMLGTFYDATVRMARAIDEAAEAIHSMFMDTAESIRMSVMSTEEQYAYLQDRAEGLFEQLLTETDPAKIQDIATRINSDINAAWGLLDDSQRAALAEQYIERIDSVDAYVADHMTALRDNVVEGATDIMQQVADRLEELFGSAASTAETNKRAADTMLDAAQNLTVSVTVDRGAIVNDSYGG